MSIPIENVPKHPRAIFDLIAVFLEKCHFDVAAFAIRSQCNGKAELLQRPQVVDKFKDFVDSAALLLTEFETESNKTRSDKAPTAETLLGHLIDGLLQKLKASVNCLSPDKISWSIEDALGSKAFSQLTTMKKEILDNQLVAFPQQTQGMSPVGTPTTNVALPHFGNGISPVSESQLEIIRSAHYMPRKSRSGTAEADEASDEDDEYHDDDDPGYRIREIYESELLAELAHKNALAGSNGRSPKHDENRQCIAFLTKPRTASTSRLDTSDLHQDRSGVRYEPSGDAFYPVELDGTVFDSFNLRVVFERDKTGFEESKDFKIRKNSIIAARYQILEHLGSAAFSQAVQCLDLENNKMVCMKIIKNDKDFFDQSLDEIKLLKYINVNGDVDEHCVLRLYDCFYHKEHLIIVTEILRDNLYEFSKFNRESGVKPYFTLGRIQKIANQMLTALKYIHSLRLIHCDLKPENILFRSYSRCEVKVIDFGSSCFIDDHLSTYVQSRSYRAPEVLLGVSYNQKVDLWSVGCILAELWTGYVLFQNDSVQSLLARVVGIIGEFPYHMMTRGKSVPKYFTQDGQLYQEVSGGRNATMGNRLHLLVPKKTSLRQRMRTDSNEFIDFLEQLLRLDPNLRPTAQEALEHPFLTQNKYSDGL